MEWKKGLLKLARKAILSYLLGKELEIGEIPKEWLRKAATFVTLKQGGILRGCIGNVEPFEELYRSVIRNAISAAFHDPRFPPLSIHELDKTKISISILGKPEELKYETAEELLDRIRGKGVIIEKEGRTALFLPSVWEEIREPESFLSHLCMKAGLPSDCWKKHPKVYIFSVDEFGEE